MTIFDVIKINMKVNTNQELITIVDNASSKIKLNTSQKLILIVDITSSHNNKSNVLYKSKNRAIS